MATVFNQGIGSIFDNYADVIEGGNSWRGSGSKYLGLPGMYSYDEGLTSGDDTPLTVAGVQSLSTTTFDVAAGSYGWDSSRWVKNETPSFWALCTTANGSGQLNLNQARKITGYDNTTKVFTVDSAFDDTPAQNDIMTILQGFKRLPNQIDIDEEHSKIPGGFDRFFTISANHGTYEPYSGMGSRTYRTSMELKLRLLKRSKQHDIIASGFENMAILSTGIEQGGSPDHRDGVYVRALWAEDGPGVIINDEHKIVLSQSFVLVYRIGSEVL